MDRLNPITVVAPVYKRILFFCKDKKPDAMLVPENGLLVYADHLRRDKNNIDLIVGKFRVQFDIFELMELLRRLIHPNAHLFASRDAQ